MALHFLQIRCEECGVLNLYRKPNCTLLIPKIVARVRCHFCHPEMLHNVCGACRLPFSVVPFHSNGLCNSCAVREFRYNHRGAASIPACPLPQTASTSIKAAP